MIPQMNPQIQMVVGVILVAYGFLYFYKAVLALVRGKVVYWSGFLPLTIVSPWVVPGVMPSQEERAKAKQKGDKKTAKTNQKKEYDPKSGARTLTKSTEGMWVHLVMAPLFFASSLLALIAGSEYLGLSGCSKVNDALNGGKAGQDYISFSKRGGFGFPVIGHNQGKIESNIGKVQVLPVTITGRLNEAAKREMDADRIRDEANSQR